MPEVLTIAISAILGGLARPATEWLRGRQKVTTSMLDALRAEWEADRKRIELLERARDQLADTHLANVRKIYELEQERSRLTAGLAELTEQLDGTSAALADARDQVDQVRADLGLLQAERDELVADLADARAQVAALVDQVRSLDVAPVEVPPRPRPRAANGQFTKRKEG